MIQEFHVPIHQSNVSSSSQPAGGMGATGSV
jgi:hypothetical protein